MDFMKNFMQMVRDQYDVLDAQDEVRTGHKIEKPSDGIYDDAKWHYKLGFRKKVPKELGATHIGFFLRWCEENDLLSKELAEKLKENRTLFPDEGGTWSFRTFVIQKMNGTFCQNDLNEAGQTFADVYYTGKKQSFQRNTAPFWRTMKRWSPSCTASTVGSITE